MRQQKRTPSAAGIEAAAAAEETVREQLSKSKLGPGVITEVLFWENHVRGPRKATRRFSAFWWKPFCVSHHDDDVIPDATGGGGTTTALNYC
jgi:hypothetical protein